MSRCLACCQENCGYHSCGCDCHEPIKIAAPIDRIPLGRSTRQILPIEHPCRLCGVIGAHYCTGSPYSETRIWSNEVLKSTAEAASGQCPNHKRYQAKRKPRSNCEACWRIWIALNPR